MLKLEREKNKQILISYYRRSPFFNYLFLQALAIAIGVHLFGFVLFKVKDYLFLNEPILPPSQVEVDMSNSLEAETLCCFEDQRKLDYILEPSQPQFEIKAHLPLRQMDEDLKATVIPTLFDTIEAIDTRFDEKKLRAHMTVSGPVAQFLLQSPQVPVVSNEDQARYEIKVDAQSGKVFWFIAKEAPRTENKVIAENLISQLFFEIDPSLVIQEGEVAIFFQSI